MTAVITRSPLQTLSMSSTQRPARRRSARHAFEDEEAPPAKRSKTENAGAGASNGTARQVNGKANGAASKRAKTAYDEDDDGFQFSRTRSKKAQPKLTPAPEPTTAESKAPPPNRRKKNSLNAPPPPPDSEAAPKRRRSARLSGDKEAIEPPVEKPKRAKRTASPQPVKAKDDSPKLASNDLFVSKKRDGTKIALPFADTPIIRRNKEMRKGSGQGHRRSSTGMRGRRASSLIDSGTSNGGISNTFINNTPTKEEDDRADCVVGDAAVPHADVETREFYKHIEQSLPEPRRMKQLLTWCGTRALPEKPAGSTGDTNAILAADAARHIQEELLKDFANKSEMSDWFNREEVAPTVLVKKSNPRNAQNAAKLQELEKEIARLQDEKRSWESLLASSSSLLEAPLSTSKTAIEADAKPPLMDPSSTPIDSSLLDDSAQVAILDVLTLQRKRPGTEPTSSTSSTQLQARLQHISQTLEPQIDLFADGVHKLGQYRLAAERVADRILGAATERLEERDREARQESGTGDVSMHDVLGALGSTLARREG